MKKVTFTLFLLLPFIQGCGLSGAYIFFGDKAWNSYKEAIKNSQIDMENQSIYSVNQQNLSICFETC